MAVLKLKAKMLLGYAAPTLVYLLIAGLAYSTAQGVFTTLQDVKRVQAVLKSSDEIKLSAQGMIRNARGYLLDNNKDSDFAKQYKDNYEQVQSEYKNILTLVKLSEQKERLDKMLVAINGYHDFASEMIRLINQGKQADAVALFKTRNGAKYVEEFDRLSGEFTKTEEELLGRQMTQTEGSLSFLIAALLIGSVLLLTLAITIALYISGGVSSTITQAVLAISNSSTEIAATVEQQERNASQQAASVNETTSTMDELGASSRQSATQSESAANDARQVLSLVDGNGYQGKGEASLRAKVGAIAEQILRLSEQTSQIGNIAGIVSDLANQTNMLSLNAAVEAARAGEHGKGFAVVASEIRKLADQSKQSAEKINTLVSDIQSATNSTVMVTDEGSKMVEGIVAAVNNIVLNSQQISLTSKQQAIAIQQVIEAMNAINQGASQTATGTSQTKIGIQNLSQAALNLKSVI